jgi:iron complex outermembrane receptor protein
VRLQGTLKRSGNLRAPDYWLGNTGTSLGSVSGMTGWKTQLQERSFRHELAFSSFHQKLAILRTAHIGSLTELQTAIASAVPLKNPDSFFYNIDRPRQEIQHQTARYRLSALLTDYWRFTVQYGLQHNHRQEFDVVRRSNGSRPQLSFRLWTHSAEVAVEHLALGHWQGGGWFSGGLSDERCRKGRLYT